MYILEHAERWKLNVSKCLNKEKDKNHFAFTRHIRANIVIEFYYFFYVKFLKCSKLKKFVFENWSHRTNVY